MHHISMNDVCEGMKVCDKNGNPIGTISNLLPASRTVGGQQASNQGCVQVSANLPNIPNQLYIPLDEFRECKQDTCYLNLDKNELSNRGFDQRPSNI